MEELEYRKLVDLVFKTIENAFDAVDPDVAECEFSQGAMTILFADRTKFILSQQPSVRQIWVALAAKGVAHHFNYDAAQKKWFDDKGKGVELVAYVRTMVAECSGVTLAL